MSDELKSAKESQLYKLGQADERERILYILENTPFIWMGDVQLVQVGRQHLINLIKGETN